MAVNSPIKELEEFVVFMITDKIGIMIFSEENIYDKEVKYLTELNI
jgi:hypothetical protein